MSAPAHTPTAPSILAIASGKGGVGKTWLSVTLAQALARAGQRVLLGDGDLGLANVDVQLGLLPEHDLAELLAGEGSPASAILTVEHGPNGQGRFDVLPGRSGSGALGALSLEELGRLADLLIGLKGRYDRVILDTAAGIDPAVTLLCGLSSRTLVVLTEDPTSLTDAYALVKVLSRGPRPPVMEVVVNMAPDLVDGRRIHKALAQACLRFLGFEPALLGVIRRDAHVRQAIRAQAPLLARYPQAQAAADVQALAARILAESPERSRHRKLA
ncbi:MAG: AAA family ATPase [Alphaproteobacteria bacterium]|nr:AAA family ATPase [Alphaproteobacteria bacterium]